MSREKKPEAPESSQSGGCPFSAQPSDPATYGSMDLTYNEYLKIPELLKLQVPQSDPAHHDELLFIIIHQSYELWFKLILHELANCIEYMRKKEVLRAHHFMKRVVEIMRLLVPQIHILETMTPAEFLEFRDKLMPASGFQSLQFRELEFVAGLKDRAYMGFFKNKPEMTDVLEKRIKDPDVRSTYYEMLGALGFDLPTNVTEIDTENDPVARERILDALLPIYQYPEKHLPLYLLSESLVEFDEYLALWREHHVRVVERIIGFKRGTGGSSGVGYLKSTVTKKCFPLLWEVRTHLEKRR